jgi:uncharacterized protein YchJ
MGILKPNKKKKINKNRFLNDSNLWAKIDDTIPKLNKRIDMCICILNPAINPRITILRFL